MQETFIEDEHGVIVDLVPQLLYLLGSARPGTVFDHDQLVFVLHRIVRHEIDHVGFVDSGQGSLLSSEGRAWVFTQLILDAGESTATPAYPGDRQVAPGRHRQCKADLVQKHDDYSDGICVEHQTLEKTEFEAAPGRS